MDVDHRAGREVKRAPGGRARGAGGERKLFRRRRAGPAGVVLQAAGVLKPAQHLGQLVLDGLIGADRAPEREPLLGVGDADVQTRLDRAD